MTLDEFIKTASLRGLERIRRITGYLQKTGQWNNAKRAEERDRVKRGLANQCVTCGAEMPEGDHVCKLCREGEK